MRTLHELTHEEGHDHVAASIGITPRSLTNKRAGVNPLTVDDLYRLSKMWPEFDIVRTVETIGRRRNARAGRPWKRGTMYLDAAGMDRLLESTSVEN